MDHSFDKLEEDICNPLSTDNEVGNQILNIKSNDHVVHAFRNLLQKEKFDLGLSIHGGGFYLRCLFILFIIIPFFKENFLRIINT